MRVDFSPLFQPDFLEVLVIPATSSADCPLRLCESFSPDFSSFFHIFSILLPFRTLSTYFMRPFRRLPAILFIFFKFAHFICFFLCIGFRTVLVHLAHIDIFTVFFKFFALFHRKNAMQSHSVIYIFLSIDFISRRGSRFRLSPARDPSSQAHGARHARPLDASGKSAGQSPLHPARPSAPWRRC